MNQSQGVVVKNLTLAYQGNPVLEDVSFSVPSGTLSAIVGPNGGGKTTLMKGMLGLLKPLSGEVAFPTCTRGKKDRVYVPQRETVDWDFPITVIEVVMMGRYGSLGWGRRPGRRDRTLAMETLQEVGMANYAQTQIGQLSGGQQQRVFLARALIQQGEVYLLDEPFKGVDAQSEGVVIDLLRRLKERGKTLLVVHHDLQTLGDYFDHVTLLNQRVIASGETQEVCTPSLLAQTYEGRL